MALAAVAVVALGAVGFSALFANAAAGPVVTTTTTNNANVVVTSAVIGTNVIEGAAVSSSTSSTLPTGTVTFNTYANLTCSGTATVQSGVNLVNGMASSSAFVMTSAGLSYIVNYNGDATNTPSVSSCTVVTPRSATVSITNNLSATSVNAGSTVTNHATLSGNTAAATGTVAYNVYTNNTCTLSTTSAATVLVTNGTVPTSAPVVFNQAGNFYWQSVYSGDNANAGATSACTLLTVLPVNTPVPPVATTTPGTGTISGTVFNDVNQNEKFDSGDTGLAGILIWLHLGKHNYNAPIVATTTTDSLGHYIFSNLAKGTYFVEQQLAAGFNQTSDDQKVKISNKKTSAVVNFSNVSLNASSTVSGDENDGESNDDNNGNKDNKWSRFASSTLQVNINANVHSFLKGENGNHNGNSNSKGEGNGKND
jgi:hypothetical protein